MNTEYFAIENSHGVSIIRAVDQPFENFAYEENIELQKELVEEFRSKMQNAGNLLVVDLSDIGLVKSLTLNIIVRMLKDPPESISKMTFCGLSYMLEIWEMMKFESFFGRCFESLDEAIESVKEESA